MLLPIIGRQDGSARQNRQLVNPIARLLPCAAHLIYFPPMSPDRSTSNLLERLRSARLVRVVIIYLAASWFVVQALDILAQHFTLPSWFFPAGLALLAIGLPILISTALIQARLRQADASAAARLLTRGSTSWSAPGRLFTWRRAILGGVLAFAALGSLGIGLVWSRNRSISAGPKPSSPRRGLPMPTTTTLPSIIGRKIFSVAGFPFFLRKTDPPKAVYSSLVVKLVFLRQRAHRILKRSARSRSFLDTKKFSSMRPICLW